MSRIYKLIDPRDNLPRYIGLTIDHLLLRMCKHISTYQSHLKNNPKSKFLNWLKGLVENNLLPIILLVEEVNKDEESERERFWVGEYRKNYPGLILNISNGGRGISMLGENHPNFKISDDDAESIKKKWATGKYTLDELADLNDVHRSTIKRIVYNQRNNPDFCKKKRLRNAQKRKKKGQD